MRTRILHVVIIILMALAFPCDALSKAPKLVFNILNLDREVLNNVSAQLGLKQKSLQSYDFDSLNSFYKSLPQEISKMLKNYGYFRSTVKISKYTYSKDKWEATFKIYLGPPINISKINLKIEGYGKNDKNIHQGLTSFPLKVGDIFRTDRYSFAKQFLFDLADAHGYAEAYLKTKKVFVDLKKNTAEIILCLETGKQYFFGMTLFHASSFSKKFLAKYLPYKSGEIYSNKKLYLLKENLNNSNFFHDISVTPHLTKNGSPMAKIEVALTPRKRKRYNIGIGYGTNMGAQGALEVEAYNLTAMGHSLKGSVQGSQVQNGFAMHYLIPGSQPTTDLYDINLAGETTNFSKGRNTTLQTSIGYTTMIKGWSQTIKLSLQHEHYKLEGYSYKVANLFIPSINWEYSKKDDLVRPNNGYGVKINVRGASQYALASDSFLQAKIEAKYLTTFSSKLQILLHTVLGSTYVNEINNLPLSLQFYAGGTQSIRGFGYNAIGPGRNLIIGSAELRYPIINDLYLATFYDTGNASNSLNAKLNSGVGCGLVYRTSIGTFELTYAKAISQPGIPGRIQFSLGADL